MKRILLLFFAFNCTMLLVGQKKIEILPANIVAVAGSQISVPVFITGFDTDTTSLVAIEFYLDFDNSVLTFDSVTNVNALMPEQEWFFSAPNPSLDRFACNWAEPSFVNNISVPGETMLFVLKFTYNGGQSILDFDEATSLFVHLDPSFNFITLMVDYFNGNVVQEINQNTTNWNGDGTWNTVQNWSAGIPTLESVAIIQSGTVNLQNALGAARKLEIMSNAIVNIFPANALTVVDTLLNNGLLHLISSSTGSGSLIINGRAFGTGNYQIEQYLADGIHLMGAPINNSNINVFGSSPVSTWNEASASFTSLAAGTVMETGRGYKVEIPQSTSVVFDGNSLCQDNIIVSLSNSNSGSIQTEGINLVCNPYPSAVEWLAGDWQLQNVGKAIYVWDKTRYRVWNGYLGDINNGIIPAMQGFIVKATGNNPQITIPNNSRIHSNQPFYKEMRLTENSLTIEFGKLEGGNPGVVEDAVFYQLIADATMGFDAEYDAYKLPGLDGSTMAYSILDDENSEKMAIDVRPSLDGNFPSVALGFIPADAGTYYLRLKNVNSFDENIPIVIQDLGMGVAYPGDEIDMRVNVTDFTYSFNADPIDNPYRFNLFFSPVGIEEIQTSSCIRMQHSGTKLIITANCQELQNAHLEIFDMMGRKLLSEIPDLVNEQFVDISRIKGVFIARLSLNGQLMIIRKFCN